MFFCKNLRANEVGKSGFGSVRRCGKTDLGCAASVAELTLSWI
jgi:hypothetical protein